MDGGITPSASLSNPFPNGEVAPTGSSLGALTLLGQSVQGNLRTLRRGYSEQGSFSVQQEFPGNWLVEAGYVANRGVRLPVNASFDYLPVSNFSMGTALQKLVANPYYGIIPSQYALGKETVPAASLLDTYPQFSGVTGLASLADSMYNAGTLRVERRFSHGLGLLLSYTLSKLIDDNSGDGANAFADSGSDAVRDWGNISRERAVSAQHQPHHLVISGSYEMPFGRRGPLLYREVAGG